MAAFFDFQTWGTVKRWRQKRRVSGFEHFVDVDLERHPASDSHARSSAVVAARSTRYPSVRLAQEGRRLRGAAAVYSGLASNGR